jgi:uncharacterized protein YkwD
MRPTVTRTFASPRRYAAGFLALSMILATFVVSQATAQAAGPSARATATRAVALSASEATFTNRLNRARTARGVPRLTVRTSLVAVARAQAARMARRHTMYHNPNLTRDVHNWSAVGENVGFGPNAVRIHAALMASLPHRHNILDTDYTEIGIGTVVRNGRVWVAEVFRRPMHRA